MSLDPWIVSLVLASGFLTWAFVCNERTYRQRMRLIDHVYAQKNWMQARDGTFGTVSYGQHLVALVLLRNPVKLYGEWGWLLFGDRALSAKAPQ